MDYLIIGSIGRSYGLQGWLKLNSFSGEWKHFSVLKTVILEKNHLVKPQTFHVEGFRMLGGRGLIKLKTINTRESATLLTGMQIHVPRDQASEINKDEWYCSDLIGIRVLDQEGNEIGQISHIIETSDDLLEITIKDGKQVLVPFRKDFFTEPDIKKQTIILRSPGIWIE